MISIRFVHLLVYITWAYFSCASCFDHKSLSSAKLVYSWIALDFDFGSDEQRQSALQTKAYIPEHCAPTKVESYKGCFYIATPRIFSGAPFSLVKIVNKEDESPILTPFPNKEIQTLGDCNAIQNSLAFKIDVNTDIMWILDVGHILFPDDDDPFRTSFCPAKVVAVKVRTGREVTRYVFPGSVVPIETNFLNDLALDYVKGELSFIYITDSNSATLVVLDIIRRKSFSIKHTSMSADPAAFVIPFANGLPPLEGSVAINGIAISCDFRYVYYHSLNGFDFFRIPTDVLRNGGEDFNETVEALGRRNHMVDGMTYSTKHKLYYTATNDSALDRWLVGSDAAKQGTFENLRIESVQRLAQNNLKMEFTAALDIDEHGVLYFLAPRVNRMLQDLLDISGRNGTNFHIWRLKLNMRERSYLWRARQRTAPWRKYVSRRCDKLY